jgi:hypothetical protein
VPPHISHFCFVIALDNKLVLWHFGVMSIISIHCSSGQS